MPLKKPAYYLQTIITISSLMLLSLVMKMPVAYAADYPILTDTQKEWLGQQIFNNECALQLNCLTAWNSGEDFPSLGIGHFIWYRENQSDIFEESFPALMDYFESEGISIPAWIVESNYDSPWQNRDEFLADFAESELAGLRALLVSTMPAQTTFIITRFESALKKILAVTAIAEQNTIENKFYAVANSHPPYGMYALIDYVNFKGEGIATTEQYAQQGWGLLQVLENMSLTAPDILENYVASAKAVLENRAQNAPAERNEARWLPGWFNRLDSYLPPHLLAQTASGQPALMTTTP